LEGITCLFFVERRCFNFDKSPINLVHDECTPRTFQSYL
jgi:hypothetical protein